MVFSEAQLRSWVRDRGTRFVPPQNKYYDFDPSFIKGVSAERQQLTDEDVRRALPMLGAAVDIDLGDCALLTDAIIAEIGRGCPNLTTLSLQYASPRAAAASRARRFRLSRARAFDPFLSLSSGAAA